MRLVRRGVWGMCVAVLVLAGCHGAEDKKDKGGQAAGGGPQSTGPGANKKQTVQVLKLTPGPIRDTGDYLGTLVSRSSITVYPVVAGYVRHIAVKPGQQVKRGQLLLEVDPRRERAGVQSAEAQRSSALAQRAYARSTRARAEQLLKEGLMSRQDYEQLVSQAAAADASSRSAEAQLQEQQVELSYYRVTAPFDGVVGQIPVKLGDSVSTQTVLTSVDQSRALEVSVSVSPERATQVKLGSTQVHVLDDDEKTVVSAPVFFVSPTPNPATQLVELRAAFDNTQGLRAGQVSHVEVEYSARDALRLPTYAVTQQSSQFFVMVAAEGDGGGTVVQRTPVKLGQLQDNHYEVLEGLREGTPVIVGSLQSIRDGQPIETQPAKPPPDEQAGVGGAGDAGTAGPGDAGTPRDAGTPGDAGTARDAGMARDAGTDGGR